jgi:hypothetical protein
MNEKHNNTIGGNYKINMKLTCIFWPHSIGQNYLTHYNKLLQKKKSWWWSTSCFLMVQHSPSYAWTIINACLHAWAWLVTTCHIVRSSYTHLTNLTNLTQEKPLETFLFEWLEISHTCCPPLKESNATNRSKFTLAWSSYEFPKEIPKLIPNWILEIIFQFQNLIN